MADGSHDRQADGLTPRDPSLEDVVNLCAELNRRGASYVVVGGFAIRAAGYARHTNDLDLVISVDLENEAKVFKALESLPDQCVKELDPGDVAKHVVVRIADEIVVDLMATASGIGYADARRSVSMHEINGVRIPFASPDLLWQMKRNTHREKDIPDLVFLRRWFEAQGRTPPE